MTTERPADSETPPQAETITIPKPVFHATPLGFVALGSLVVAATSAAVDASGLTEGIAGTLVRALNADAGAARDILVLVTAPPKRPARLPLSPGAIFETILGRSPAAPPAPPQGPLEQPLANVEAAAEDRSAAA